VAAIRRIPYPTLFSYSVKSLLQAGGPPSVHYDLCRSKFSPLPLSCFANHYYEYTHCPPRPHLGVTIPPPFRISSKEPFSHDSFFSFYIDNLRLGSFSPGTNSDGQLLVRVFCIVAYSSIPQEIFGAVTIIVLRGGDPTRALSCRLRDLFLPTVYSFPLWRTPTHRFLFDLFADDSLFPPCGLRIKSCGPQVQKSNVFPLRISRLSECPVGPL